MISTKSKSSNVIGSYLMRIAMLFATIIIGSLILAALIINEIAGVGSIKVGVKVILALSGLICGFLFMRKKPRNKLKSFGIVSGIIALVFLGISIIVSGKIVGSIIFNILIIIAAMMIGSFAPVKNMPKNKKFKMRYR